MNICLILILNHDVPGALNFAAEIGYPLSFVLVFAMAATGGGIANNETELNPEITANGLKYSPVNPCLIENQCRF